MGIFRLKMGPDHLEEALRHFNYFDPSRGLPEEMITEFVDVLREICDVLIQDQYWHEFLRFFEILAKTGMYVDSVSRRHAGIAALACGQDDHQ